MKMEATLRVFSLTVFFFSFVRSAVLPVDRCKLEDSRCMTSAFQKALPIFAAGMPDLNVESLDPLQLEDMAFNLSGLQFTLKNGVMKGFRNAIVDKVKWDLKKKRFEVDYHLNGTVRGDYTAGGRILVLPISGDGQMRLKLWNLAVNFFMDYNVEKDPNGMDHIVPYKYDFTFTVRDNANYNLTNLFNGNKQLSETMLNFLNENWKQVSEEFGRPLMQAAAEKVYSNIGNFFASVPLDDIANV